MIQKGKKLKIPKEEKLYILPDAREKLFMDMLNEYKKRCPGLKLIYAYLNYEPSLPIDYIIIFKAKSDDGKTDLIIFDIPYLYSDRTTPGYRYCKRENLLNDFFEESTVQMTCLSKSRFNEYLNTMLNLSIKKDEPTYWKNPNNAVDLGRGLTDLSARYVKK